LAKVRLTLEVFLCTPVIGFSSYPCTTPPFPLFLHLFLSSREAQPGDDKHPGAGSFEWGRKNAIMDANLPNNAKNSKGRREEELSTGRYVLNGRQNNNNENNKQTQEGVTKG
jgi:hypothetical protein